MVQRNITLNVVIIDDDIDIGNGNDFIDQINIIPHQVNESIPIVYHGIHEVATMTISYNIYCDKSYIIKLYQTTYNAYWTV